MVTVVGADIHTKGIPVQGLFTYCEQIIFAQSVTVNGYPHCRVDSIDCHLY